MWPIGQTSMTELFIYNSGHIIEDTAQKMKFCMKDFFSKCDQILNGKLHFFCALKEVLSMKCYSQMYLECRLYVMK